MKEKLKDKRLIATIVLILVALISMFCISKLTSSAEFHKNTIKSLDDKKITVIELTAATAGTATAIAALPSDSTTPIANQIMDLSSYLLIVVGVIFLEKILLTLTGNIAFAVLIPVACALYIVYIYSQKDVLKNLAIKLAAFGLVVFMVVPISVKVSDFIESTYKDTIDQTIQAAENLDKEVEESEKENKQEEVEQGIWGTITSTVTDAISSIGDGVSKLIEKGKNILSRFIDAIAILLITTCVIPIAVLFFIIWIIKIIFGISIPIKDVKKIKIKPEKVKEG